MKLKSVLVDKDIVTKHQARAYLEKNCRDLGQVVLAVDADLQGDDCLLERQAPGLGLGGQGFSQFQSAAAVHREDPGCEHRLVWVWADE